LISAIAVLAMAGLGGAGWIMLRHSGEATQAAAVEAVPAVGVQPVVSKGVSHSFEFVGRVKAIEKVDVRARVEGFLEKVLFREGQDIKAGDLLYQIEKVQFQALLDQTRANLVAAEAEAVKAKVDHDRAVELAKQNISSVAHVDHAQAALATANGRVLQMKAVMLQAEVNLGYTDIRAPIDGRIGRAAYTTGNLVNPASGVLSTIVSQDPVYVQFPVSVRDLETIREARHKEGGLAKVEIRLRLSNGRDYAERGAWNFTDPQVNQHTDSLLMRGTVANPERALSDGQFVTAIIQERHQDPKLVVPHAALQVDQSGYYALIVDADHKVQQRRVRVGTKHQNDLLVLSGLREGELVIVDGIQKVRPGQVVRESILPAPTAD
jgi:membrane fusion protein (multidrug efflux system)